MRFALPLTGILVWSAAVLAGCGYAGEPKPPALRRPMKVTELLAVERGAKIVVTFTLPWQTTEGMPITGTEDVELRIGVMPSTWNPDVWAANSERVPVPGLIPASIPVRQAARVAAGTAGAGGASGKRSLLGLVKGPAKRPVKGAGPKPAPHTLTVEIDASKYIDKSALIGVRVHGPEGRDDGWATVSVDVAPVLAAPRNLQAKDAPNAVHLEWTADAPAFRIFRRLGSGNGNNAPEWAQIGENAQAFFDDKTFDYGKTWQYYVQSVRQVGDRWVESEPSETLTFAPMDRFPPAVPAGLVVIAGTKTMELSWDSVADSDLAGYRVYRNGAKIADGLATNSYSDKDVSAGATYSYRVSAVDQAGNESEKCGAVERVME
jgi:hypothetical protein